MRDLAARTEHTPPGGTRANRGLLALAVLLFFVEFPLLRFGSPESLADKIGVGVVLLQWLLINAALTLHES